MTSLSRRLRSAARLDGPAERRQRARMLRGQGRTVREIAMMLGVSDRCARNYVSGRPSAPTTRSGSNGRDGRP
jgi:predicted transcriptional regulator